LKSCASRYPNSWRSDFHNININNPKPRMRNSALLLLILLAGHATGWSQREVTAPVSDYEGDVRDLRVLDHISNHPGFTRFWAAYIAEWSAGSAGRRHLVAAYCVQLEGKTDMGDIICVVSRDDGDTWTAPIRIFDHTERMGRLQFAYCNAILFKPDGHDVLWCFAMRSPLTPRNSEEGQLVAAYSPDGGYSWIPVELAMHYTGHLVVVAGLHESTILGQKRYLLPAHRNTLQKDPFGDREHFVLSSSNLLEWRLEAFIPQPAEGPRVFLHEGNIAPGDRPGELKIVMRTAGYEDANLTTDPPRAYSSVSLDGGRTWSPAAPESELHNAKAKGFFGRAADGTHIYVYNDGPQQRDRSWPGWPHGGRTSLRYKIKPAGAQWSGERTFFHAGIKNSYPTLIEVAPREFRAVWDSGTASQPRTHVHFGKLKLPD
jgi:hypothetical protein